MAWEIQYQNIVDSARKPLVAWCCVVLLGVLIVMSGLSTVRLLNFKPVVDMPKATVHASPKIIDTSSLHLFGIAPAKDIPLSSLNLHLRGVLTGAAPQVIVSGGTSLDKVYHRGDSLPGGAVIKTILPNAIIIIYNHRMQRLLLPDKRLVFSPAPKPWGK